YLTHQVIPVGGSELATTLLVRAMEFVHQPVADLELSAGGGNHPVRHADTLCGRGLDNLTMNFGIDCDSKRRRRVLAGHRPSNCPHPPMNQHQISAIAESYTLRDLQLGIPVAGLPKITATRGLDQQHSARSDGTERVTPVAMRAGSRLAASGNHSSIH